MAKNWTKRLESFKARRAKIMELKNEGWSLNDLAKRYSVSVTQINNLLKKARHDLQQ